MAWAAAIGPIIEMATGFIKKSQTDAALDRLPDPMEYKVSPEFKQFQAMSKRRADQGASAVEEAAFRERQAQQSAGAERNLRNMGLGAFAPATQAMYGNQANMDFTQMSENERRRGEVMFGNAAKTSMDVQHKQVDSFNDILLRQQEALGGAAASANKDISSGAMGIGGVATDLIQNLFGGTGGGMGGGMGSFGRAAAPKGTSSGLNLDGYEVSMSPNYDPSTDAMSGGFESSLD